MSRVFRVLRKKYARSPFDGEGAYRYGGRWSSPGTRLSYTSERQSLALLEYFVHLDKDDPPSDLVLAVAEVPEDLNRERVAVTRLPASWRDPATLRRPLSSRGLAMNSRTEGEHCLFVVPSVLAPSENNCLINPEHRDFRRIVIREPEPLSYDPRMFARRHKQRRRA